jgi:hypothetical protein
MFSSIKSQTRYKIRFYVLFSSSSTTCPFQSMTALHTIFRMRLLPEKVTSCCDLPKQSTCPLYIFCLQYSNSQIVTISNHIMTVTDSPNENTRSSSQIPLIHADQVINCTKHDNQSFKLFIRSK